MSRPRALALVADDRRRITKGPARAGRLALCAREKGPAHRNRALGGRVMGPEGGRWDGLIGVGQAIDGRIRARVGHKEQRKQTHMGWRRPGLFGFGAGATKQAVAVCERAGLRGPPAVGREGKRGGVGRLGAERRCTVRKPRTRGAGQCDRNDRKSHMGKKLMTTREQQPQGRPARARTTSVPGRARHRQPLTGARLDHSTPCTLLRSHRCRHAASHAHSGRALA